MLRTKPPPRAKWQERLGIACPTCRSQHSHVVDSRTLGGTYTRRRRECDNGYRFTTYERFEFEIFPFEVSPFATLAPQPAAETV